MPRGVIERIRQMVRDGQVVLTAHAQEEMAKDELIFADVKSALLEGRIRRTDTDDPRGARYLIVGRSADWKRDVGVVGRFTVTAYLIITVYEVELD